jgi:hypothetical protein
MVFVGGFGADSSGLIWISKNLHPKLCITLRDPFARNNASYEKKRKRRLSGILFFSLAFSKTLVGGSVIQ